ncbi:MAG: DUF3015 family protein [Elusimicrobia bacterium]|nr:DUF3015 family protein [Elusimicrobiota bacterium]
MRKVLALAAAAVLGTSGLAMAAGGNHPMAGCGLGYVLFGHNDNTPVMQVLAATTNGISGNQTFGMTTGTSGCTEDGAVKFVKEAEVYAEVNLESLRREMAAGQGEFVTSFAALIGARGEQIPQMVQLFQKNYDKLFPTAGTTSGEMMSSLSKVLSEKNA